MQAIEDLIQLVSIPSLSGEEQDAANWMQEKLESNGFPTQRLYNNVWAWAFAPDPNKPTVLLNSHLDTVKPVSGWTAEPYTVTREEEKLIGLGINDAGASLIGLLHAFFRIARSFHKEELPYNLIFLASAEEENSGPKGMELVRSHLGEIAMAIVGEPTGCKAAVSEKGLLVIDATAKGTAGHAARNTGDNALYKAVEDIMKLKSHSFAKVSPTLGPVSLNVTAVKGGELHNVIPDTCSYTIDIRLNDCYTHQEILDELQQLCSADLKARSMRLCPSGLKENHPLFRTAVKIGVECYGSPTMSDQALMPWPSLKMGIGESERSHSANEFIYEYELREGVGHYEQFLISLRNEIME